MMYRLKKRKPIDANTYDSDILKNMLKTMTPAEIAKHFKVDPRHIHRALRNARITNTPEPVESIRLRIKDTEIGRKLASGLGLKVGVIYPESDDGVYQRSDN